MRVLLAIGSLFFLTQVALATGPVSISGPRAQVLTKALGDVALDRYGNFIQSFHNVTCSSGTRDVCSLENSLLDDEGNVIVQKIRGAAARILISTLQQLDNQKKNHSLKCIIYTSRSPEESICIVK